MMIHILPAVTTAEIVVANFLAKSVDLLSPPGLFPPLSAGKQGGIKPGGDSTYNPIYLRHNIARTLPQV
jgi:hypothetical protein